MSVAIELSKFEEDSVEYKFFQKVLAKLEKKFLRKSVENRLNEIQFSLSTTIENYFKLYVFVNAVAKAHEQLRSQQKYSSFCQRDVEFQTADVDSLYINMLSRYLPSPKSLDAQKLLGLDMSSAVKAVQGKQKSKVEKEVMKKEIEKNINEYCINITKSIGYHVPGRNWKDAFNQTMKDIECKATLLHEKKLETNKRLQELVKSYYEELFRGIYLLKELLSSHIEKLKFGSSVVDLYRLRCNAVFLKTRILEMKVLRSTYDENTTPALKKISLWLDQKEKQLKDEINGNTLALETYTKLGEEYELCVDEYLQITKGVQEQKWFLEELKIARCRYETSSS